MCAYFSLSGLGISLSALKGLRRPTAILWALPSAQCLAKLVAPGKLHAVVRLSNGANKASM